MSVPGHCALIKAFVLIIERLGSGLCGQVPRLVYVCIFIFRGGSIDCWCYVVQSTCPILFCLNLLTAAEWDEHCIAKDLYSWVPFSFSIDLCAEFDVRTCVDLIAHEYVGKCSTCSKIDKIRRCNERRMIQEIYKKAHAFHRGSMYNHEGKDQVRALWCMYVCWHGTPSIMICFFLLICTYCWSSYRQRAYKALVTLTTGRGPKFETFDETIAGA